jgi:peptidoglycan/xylan/chitin deacetylase (PgdA/CDA1 family)
MKRISSLFIATMLTTVAGVAQTDHPAHANRKQALELLRSEGVLHDKDRVTAASWTGDFWIISLRRPNGRESNWSVDRYARECGYICKH